MRNGLLALSLAMLASGGVAAQSALSISNSASAAVPASPPAQTERSGSYGSMPFTEARSHGARIGAL